MPLTVLRYIGVHFVNELSVAARPLLLSSITVFSILNTVYSGNSFLTIKLIHFSSGKFLCFGNRL